MKGIFGKLLLVVLLLAVWGAWPASVSAAPPPFSPDFDHPLKSGALPRLNDFIAQVKNGNASQVTGIYAYGLFAFPVVQQPANQPAFVSSEDGVITQFAMASSYGSLGFLAHNTLAGAEFSSIQVDQVIAVVYGDGRYVNYRVTEIRKYQATRPNSPYSSFIDLATKKKLTAQQLFMQTYGIKGALVLQTCIASNGIDTWGRMFIIAKPETSGSGK